MIEPDATRLQAVVSTLAADGFAGRRVGTAGGRHASRYLAGELRTAGASVHMQEFLVNDVRELHDIPTMTWTVSGRRRVLTFRKDFCEHTASAERDSVLDAPVAGKDVDSTAGTWVLHDSFSYKAIAQAEITGAIGVIVPRVPDSAGWMPKMIAGPDPAPLPVLVLHSDLHDELRNAGTAEVTATMPLRRVTATGQNVVGTFREAAAGAPAVLLTAHYDGVGDDPDGTRYPAACDNASGVSSVMEAARILDQLLPPGVGLQVALLDGEEVGAHGSAVHAETVPMGTHVINLDGAAALSVAHVEASGAAEELLRCLDLAAREVGVPLKPQAMPSDNRRYGAAGLAVVGIGMGMPGYQTPLETPERVETQTLIAATRLLIRTTMQLATASE